MGVAGNGIRRMFMALLSPDKPALLVIKQDSNECYDLPGLASAEFSPAKNVRSLDENVQAIATSQCGIEGVELYALRFLGWQKDDDGPFCIVEAEPGVSFVKLPANCKWLSSSDCDLIASRVRREQVRYILDPPPGELTRLAPFETRGWRGKALTWVDEVLAATELGSRKLTEGRKTGSSWNCVLRIATAGNEFFFKAVRKWNQYELRVTTRLAELFPGCTVQVVAIDDEQGWMLSRSAGDLMWRFGDDGIRCSAAQLVEGVRLFSQLQIVSVDHIKELLASGCPDRRIVYPESITRVFSLLESRLKEQVPSAKVDKLTSSCEAARSGFERLLEPLAQSSIPGCLVHSDFHAGNMAIDPGSGKPMVFDWGDCSIGHPFLSLHTCTNHPSARADGFAEILRSAYLECWQDRVPAQEIDQAAGCAKWIHALNELELAVGWLEHLGAGTPAFNSAVATAQEAFDAVIRAVEAGVVNE